MTPGIADGLALTFYLLFWMIVFLMLDYTLSQVEHYILFSWSVIIICGAIMSYLTVFLSKTSS